MSDSASTPAPLLAANDRKFCSENATKTKSPTDWSQVGLTRAELEEWRNDWGLTALSAQIGYIVHFIIMLQIISEINENVDNVACCEYIQ